MFQKTKLNRCLLTAFGGAAVLSSGLAFGQAQLERVEITGSSIKRSIASEGALPVTILKAEELRQQGVTSVEGIVQLLTASQSSAGGSNWVTAKHWFCSTAAAWQLSPLVWTQLT
jgi:hypothetical protein